VTETCKLSFLKKFGAFYCQRFSYFRYTVYIGYWRRFVDCDSRLPSITLTWQASRIIRHINRRVTRRPPTEFYCEWSRSYRPNLSGKL